MLDVGRSMLNVHLFKGLIDSCKPNMKPSKYPVRTESPVLTIDNPPVNPMTPQLRRDLRDAFEEALVDPGAKAIILTGTVRTSLPVPTSPKLQSLKTREEGL